MAEGGFDAEMEYLLLGHDDKDNHEEEVQVDRTHPFSPTDTSTPWGEQFPLHTRFDERIGLPGTPYEETSFRGEKTASKRFWADFCYFN